MGKRKQTIFKKRWFDITNPDGNPDPGSEQQINLGPRNLVIFFVVFFYYYSSCPLGNAADPDTGSKRLYPDGNPDPGSEQQTKPLP